MTNDPKIFSLTHTTRPVHRAAIVESKKLAKQIVGRHNLPRGPVLVLPVDGPLVDLEAFFGITAFDGCDVLFLDVVVGGKYFCNVASAGDSEVINAMKHWDKTGVMPVLLETKAGPCGLVRQSFNLNEAYRAAFAASAHKDYSVQLKARFNQLLEPGILEQVVAWRTGLTFNHVQVGFLATTHSQPTLASVN
jgi:hypothetical protein